MAEAKRILPSLNQAAMPCGATAVQRALQPLVLVHGMGDRAKIPAFWEPYYAALKDLPARALKAGVDAYSRTADSEFFPKPGPLRALCEPHAEPLLRAAYRARKAIEMEARKPPPPPSEADRERVKAMLADYLAKVARKKPAPAPIKPTHGELAPGRHITPELAALMGISTQQEEAA